MKPLTANRGLPFAVRWPNLDLNVSIVICEQSFFLWQPLVQHNVRVARKVIRTPAVIARDPRCARRVLVHSEQLIVALRQLNIVTIVVSIIALYEDVLTVRVSRILHFGGSGEQVSPVLWSWLKSSLTPVTLDVFYRLIPISHIRINF